MALPSPFRSERRTADRRGPDDRRAAQTGHGLGRAGATLAPDREAREAPVSAVTEIKIRVDSTHAIIEARQHGRALAARTGFRSTDRAIIATVIHELARNILAFAQSGDVTVALVDQAGRRGLRVVAADCGPGIVDLKRALQDGYSTNGRMGIGLPGVKRLVDEFSITSVPNRGTTVTVIKWRP